MEKALFEQYKPVLKRFEAAGQGTREARAARNAPVELWRHREGVSRHVPRGVLAGLRQALRGEP